eukprot:1174230-Prorocentrum_minimum.AAC.2
MCLSTSPTARSATLAASLARRNDSTEFTTVTSAGSTMTGQCDAPARRRAESLARMASSAVAVNAVNSAAFVSHVRGA